MSNVIRKIAFISMSCAVAFAGLTGCSATGNSIDSRVELAKISTNSTDSVVFGKFRLIQNGQETRLGDRFLTASATLNLFDNSEGRAITGKVGRDGEFAWVLPAGDYSVSGISFTKNGKRIETPTNFAFTVARGYDAVYIGTVSLEATLDSGYYGMNGTVDRLTVSDNCSADCSDRLTRLGIETDHPAVALLRQEGQVASSR
jgi:hypothetical protein